MNITEYFEELLFDYDRCYGIQFHLDVRLVEKNLVTLKNHYISRVLKIFRRSLFRYRERFNLKKQLITDKQLRASIQDIVNLTPTADKVFYVFSQDSNHKLVTFRFVYIYYSRMIIYLACKPNNNSDTVLSLFENGTAKCCLVNFITGKNVHNQRIERFWAEVNRVVTKPFKQLLLFMEVQNLLDEHNEIDLFCLHYVYLPKIEGSLTEFAGDSQSPLQLWNLSYVESFHYLLNEDPNYLQNEELYGVDEHGPTLETENNVVISAFNIALIPEEHAEIQNAVPN
ncbi:hypothetical protein RN001_004853 [Aquatica leii]|uniref:Integrase core domain-containing protein n=1 Tax=Aquatica leii TaxID=1421715 RepID=A0AAN7SI73_9COLE|nr:hypothetical protein RN001_004853 [Aquatica leii]